MSILKMFVLLSCFILTTASVSQHILNYLRDEHNSYEPPNATGTCYAVQTQQKLPDRIKIDFFLDKSIITYYDAADGGTFHEYASKLSNNEGVSVLGTHTTTDPVDESLRIELLKWLNDTFHRPVVNVSSSIELYNSEHYDDSGCEGLVIVESNGNGSTVACKTCPNGKYNDKGYVWPYNTPTPACLSGIACLCEPDYVPPPVLLAPTMGEDWQADGIQFTG
jgi:hypothetical protein